jgi:hypothetical protein
MSTKNDTLFWKEIKEKSIPDKVLPMYNAVIDGPLSRIEFLNFVMKNRPYNNLYSAETVFSTHHWWQLLKGCGRYENIKKSYSDDFIKYSKMVLNSHSSKIDNVLDIFPNHYDYLTKWYETS